MGVRPPAGDDLSDPDTVEFGIAALDGTLARADLSYPVDRTTVVEEIGAESVPYDAAGHTVRLAAALEEVDRDRFDSEQALKNALYPVFERRRESTTGLLGQLRSLVPF